MAFFIYVICWYNNANKIVKYQRVFNGLYYFSRSFLILQDTNVLKTSFSKHVYLLDL